jgi:hypothetical protein
VHCFTSSDPQENVKIHATKAECGDELSPVRIFAAYNHLTDVRRPLSTIQISRLQLFGVNARSGTGLTLVGTVVNKGEYSLRSTRVAIGSDPDNELVIDEPTVSRRHAEVALRAGIFEIRDLGSTNGTFVNGRKVDGLTPIQAGDEIRFGGVRFYVRAETRTQPAGRRIPRALIVVAVLLVLGAVSYQFVRNWLELLDAADSVTSHQNSAASLASLSSTGPQPTSAANSTPSSAPTVRVSLASPATTKPPVLSSSWLTLLNQYRGLAHLAPVVEDPDLSQADRLHAEYLVRNFPEAIHSGAGFGAEAHREDPRRPNYTEDGARTAGGSLVDEWEMPEWTVKEIVDPIPPPYLTAPPSESAAPEWNIDEWLSVPFHRPQIPNPLLKRVGYGMYCASSLCAASLDTLHGVAAAALPSLPAEEPIEFPPDGSQMTVRGFYFDWPDPRSSCPGYKPPSGLPITIQLGNWVPARVEDFSIRRIEGKSIHVEACAFDSESYVNPDASQQALVREILHDFGMVVVIPRRPLEEAAGYHVTITVNGAQYEWSFSTPKSS